MNEKMIFDDLEKKNLWFFLTLCAWFLIQLNVSKQIIIRDWNITRRSNSFKKRQRVKVKKKKKKKKKKKW